MQSRGQKGWRILFSQREMRSVGLSIELWRTATHDITELLTPERQSSAMKQRICSRVRSVTIGLTLHICTSVCVACADLMRGADAWLFAAPVLGFDALAWLSASGNAAPGPIMERHAEEGTYAAVLSIRCRRLRAPRPHPAEPRAPACHSSGPRQSTAGPSSVCPVAARRLRGDGCKTLDSMHTVDSDGHTAGYGRPTLWRGQ